MDTASGSAATLATTSGATQGGPAVLGPALSENMGELAHIAAPNSWGAGMHPEVLAPRADVSATQASVSSAFLQAAAALRASAASLPPAR